MPVSKISDRRRRGRGRPAGRGGSASAPRPLRARSLVVDRLAEHVPEPAERLLADRHGDRRARVDRRRRRARGRPSSPSRPRGRGRRRDAAAPRRSASTRADRRARASRCARAVLISGSPSGKTASITTPLISMILPTFWPSFCSGMCLLERRFGCAGQAAARPPARDPESSEAPLLADPAWGTPVRSLSARPPGRVVEASDVRGDERGEHLRTVRAQRAALRRGGYRSWSDRPAAQRAACGRGPDLLERVQVLERRRSAQVVARALRARRSPEASAHGSWRRSSSGLPSVASMLPMPTSATARRPPPARAAARGGAAGGRSRSAARAARAAPSGARA